MLLTGMGIVVLVVVLMLGFRGWQSQTPPELGPVDGHLRACPDKPNCVCSEKAVDSAHAVAVLATSDWQAAGRAVRDAGGFITQDNGSYLHATFTSRLFRFVDDVELRLDPDRGVIHIRSASRVGHSDFGVNRKRVQAIRERLGESS